MNILKRQLALLLVFAMTLTMLPMPAHADEGTEPESLPAIVEESTEKPMVSKEEVSTDVAKKPVENAEPDTTAKENAALVVETSTESTVDSNTGNAEEPVADIPDDAPDAEAEKELDEVIETDDVAEDAEAEETTDADASAEAGEDSATANGDESEEAEGSGVDAPVMARFSLRRSAANAAECEHPVTETAWDTNYTVTYTPVDGNQHRVSGYQNYYCTSCHQRVGESFVAAELDNHELDSDGYCSLCGYGSNTGCSHTDTETSWDTTQELTYKKYSITEHLVCGYQYAYCTSCFEKIGESVYKEEIQAHTMSGDFCTLCWYGSACPHTNTETLRDEDIPSTYTQYSSTQHKCQYYEYSYCNDCYTRVASSVQVEILENHTLGDNNMCTSCWYSENCDHDIVWKDSPLSNVGYDDLQHWVTYWKYPYCTKCEQTLGDSVRQPEIIEEHIYEDDDDYCDVCSYRRNCPHENPVEQMYTGGLPGYRSISDTQHVMYVYYYDFCFSCNNRVSELRPVDTENISDHEFDESGVCTYCGYSSVCDHSSWAQAWDDTQPITYTKYTATYHKKAGYQYSYCTNCFERGGESFAQEINENHTFNASGVCTLCDYDPNDGSGCNHENVVGTISSLDPPRYEQNNATQHLVWHTMYDRCLDCNQIISEGFDVVTGEDHVLNEKGQCTYCGYGMGEDYCKHPASDVMWSSAPMTYTSLDEEQHEVEGYQYHYCTSCYKRISAGFPVREWENHTFDSAGDCTLCDYRVGCAHSETRMKLYDTLYESLNKDSHEVTRLYSKVCADPDCGKVLVSVETSYTETDIEDHDFTGNTCHLCDYTVADQLSATVTASGLTANKGDNISATVSVVGGTGGYRYSWKILKDGSIVVENPITTSASCGTNAYEEGSYVFQVTVTDSSGNTVTALSGAITVSHACQYETVTGTQLVNQSLTHHTVETTTYEECTICHEKRNEVTDTEWVEHTPIDAESYGHEAAHPHKKYFICECGSHPYLDGEYHTANGEVQEESVCCICHGHKYGAEEETDEGTRQQTCANCGVTTVTHTHEYELVYDTELINPDETKHYEKTASTRKCKTCGHEKPGIIITLEKPHSPKNPEDYTYRTGHPHLRYAVCECGKEFDMQDEYKTANGIMQAPDVCCLCHGHVFGEPTEINSVIWKVICSVCGYEGRIAAPSQEEAETTEPTVNTDEKQELKDYNIDFIKKNALGKNDIYTLVFNDELRAVIEELSEGNAAKGYDFIDGDPAAHLGYAQADYYVDTLMKQCAELDPDSDTIRVSPGELKAICKIIGLEDTVVEAILKEWVWDDRDGCIMEADEFKDKLDQYKDDTGATLLDGLGKAVDIGTFIWDCLSDISVYNAALDGSASAMIDAAVVHMKNSDIDQAQTAAEYIEDLKDPEKRITYIIMKNAGIAEKVRDTITGATGSIPAWDIAFEAATLLNGGLFRTNDVIKSNHGTYWSLQLVDELYRNLESSIAQYENISSDKNYTACMDAYSLYITYLISSYNGVLETRENYSSSLVAQLITDKDVKEKEKALNVQYKAMMEWYEFDISAAINDFSIDQVVESIRDNGGFR